MESKTIMTEIYEWSEWRIIFLDKEDRSYHVNDREEFEKELELLSTFDYQDKEELAQAYGFDWVDYTEDNKEIVLDLVNDLFRLNDGHFERYLELVNYD